MAQLKVFTLDNLTLYDSLIKGYVDAADAKSLKTVAIEGNTLKFYKVGEPVGETAPAYEITLPQTDISGLLAKLEGATAGNVVVANADGTVKDGGVALTDLATKTEVKTVSDKVDAIENAETGVLATAKDYTDAEVKELADGAVKTNADAITKLNGDATTEGSVAKAVKDSADSINATIGTVEDGKTVVQMIADAKTAATYDDTEVRGLIEDNAEAIEAHKEAIDETVTTLVGEDTGKSVRTIANEELAKQLIAEGAQESLDTLAEIAAWIQEHPEDASAMNKAIEDLEKLVGTLPEDVTATTIVGYIAEAVAAEKTRAEKAEGEIDERLKAVEEAVGEDGSVATKIADEIAKLDADVTSAAVEEGKGVQVQVVEVDGKVTTVNVTGNYDNAYDAKGTAASAVSALENGAVKTNADAIAALQGIVGDGVVAITAEEINALFA